LTAIHLLFIACLLIYGARLLKSIREGGYGVNPGNYLFNWIKNVLEENGVHTVTDLNAKAGDIPPLTVRDPKRQNASTLRGDVTFITSEIVSQNKIEFPKMCNLFRENPDELHPAYFVRASMSIPIFFESLVIGEIPVESQKIKNAWIQHFGSDDSIPSTARFVDGGMMSNFPLNIFYNPSVVEPRLPSLGINLDDSVPQKNNSELVPHGLADYLGRLFNTIRYYYDKDFLIKNNVYKKGIGTILLSEFNWLNFFISDQEKLKMFIRGAQAARDFLLTFDWCKYQQDRVQMQLTLDADHKHEKIEMK
jgi:NTE family protein